MDGLMNNTPPSADRWALPGCCLHRTSCLGIAARSNHGSSVLRPPAVYGTTCTAPLAYTEIICTKHMKIWPSWGHSWNSTELISDVTSSHIFDHVFGELFLSTIITHLLPSHWKCGRLCFDRRVFIYLFVCVLFAKLKKYWTESHEIWWEDWLLSGDQLIRFWDRSGQSSRSKVMNRSTSSWIAWNLVGWLVIIRGPFD